MGFILFITNNVYRIFTYAIFVEIMVTAIYTKY